MAEYRLPTYKLDIPTFIDAKLRGQSIDLKVAKLGTIESYDSSKGTATVSIKTLFNEKTPKTWEYPKIPNVPVLKTKYFSHPIKQGDGCLIIFLDTDFSAWLNGGKTLTPATPRLHNLNDAIALVGIDTISERPTYGGDNTNTIIDAGEGKIVIKNEGSNNGSLLAIMQSFVTLLTNLNTSLTALTSYGYNPATLTTDITTLKTEIQKLIEGTIV
ncbi:MAG: hypothetical protein J5656_06705 [Clostridia bacterium]|nr:hypothetical protein [Clostridia bacterium]